MDAIRSDDVFAVLEEARDAGKIRAYGVALGPAIGWRDEGIEAFRTPRPGARPRSSTTCSSRIPAAS